jgi:hypothetical protein
LKTATEAGYVVAGNYPDISNTLKYGHLEYYPFASRLELFGPNPKNFAASKTILPVMNTEYNTLNGENRADSKTVQDRLSLLSVSGGVVADATWYFDHPNQIVVEFSNKESFEVQYVEAENKLSVTPKDGDAAGVAVVYSLDNSDPNQ